MPFDTTRREDLSEDPVVKNIQTARDMLAREGLWCKGAWSEDRPVFEGLETIPSKVLKASCAADALHVAMFGVGYHIALSDKKLRLGEELEPSLTTNMVIDHQRMLAASLEFTYVAAQIPNPAHSDNYDNMRKITHFNDDSATTIEDVLRVFDAAIEQARLDAQAKENANAV